jgi:hypothetical protein
VRVHTGTAGQERRPCAWVETAITYEWEWTELFYGLGSKYFRDNVAEDDELESDRPGDLPESITQAALLRIVRDEYRKWGTNNIGSWGDEISERRMQYAMAWLKELIFEAFPEMRGYDT